MAETGEGRRRAELRHGGVARLSGLEITLQLPIETQEDRVYAAEQLRQLAGMLEAGASARMAPAATSVQEPNSLVSAKQERPGSKNRRGRRRAQAEEEELRTVPQAQLDRMLPWQRMDVLRGFQGRLLNIAGGSNALLDLLVRFGVSSISELPASRQFEFLEAVRAAYRALSTR